MRIVGMEDGGCPAKLVENRPGHPGVEPEAPLGGPDSDTGGREPAGQLSLSTGDHNLIDAQSTQLPRQKPYLALPTAPLSPGSDVDDSPRHVPGNRSAGRAPVSRTDK